MDQPTPTVSDDDVARVVRRDFTAHQLDSVMAILAEYGLESWHRELDRVRLAVLKLAAGNLEALRREIEIAKCDYRDALAGAEYPNSMKISPGENLPPEHQRKIIDKDWRRYDAWLKDGP
jgi:hypothetical protein